MLRIKLTLRRASTVIPPPITPFTLHSSLSPSTPQHLHETSADWQTRADLLSQTSPIAAIPLYRKSLFTLATPTAYHNLAVCLYLTKEFEQALEQFQGAIALASKVIKQKELGGDMEAVKELKRGICDAHMNAANIYALHLAGDTFKASPQTCVSMDRTGLELALIHLERALPLSKQDGELRFNYAAILEKCDRLEDALAQYEVAVKLGIERAEMCVRNCKAKIVVKESAKSSQ